MLGRLAASLDNPPYNLVLHTAPLKEQVDATYHWHWEIHPRLREIAGLELGTGLPVNPVSPEDAVEELRTGIGGGRTAGAPAPVTVAGGGGRHTMHAGLVTAAWSTRLRIGGTHRSSAEHTWSPIPSSSNSTYRPAGLTVSAGWDRDEAYRFVEELFAKHQHEIYAYLLRMLRDPELAADLTQDAFVKAYRAYDSLEKPENARAWLYQIAHRVALDNLRRHKIVRFVPLVGEARSTAPSAEHLVMDARLSGELQRALERIPERQRTALLLAELHDLTGLELAAALGVSHVAARALLTRARESLRQALAVEREAIAAAEAADASDIDRGAGA